MGRTPRLGKRLWDGVLGRQGLGQIVIKFYPPGGQASIRVSSSLGALSRHDWHWLYLHHLAESLGAIEEQEAVRLLVAARTLAEDFVSSSYWPQVIGEKIASPNAGAAEIIPEQPGGTTLVMEVVRRIHGMPAIRLGRSSFRSRERLASSNLVLLVHVMQAAQHPLEQYEVFKKITLFSEYCDRYGRWHNKATLKNAPLYAVVHADIAAIAPPADDASRGAAARSADSQAPAVPAPPPPPLRVPRPRRHLWERPGAAIAAAVLVWTGLIVGAFFAPRNSGVSPVPSRNAADLQSTGTYDASPPPDRALDARNALGLPRASAAPRAMPGGRGGSGDLRRRTPEATPQPVLQGPSDFPRFRVVSRPLARAVAELRAKMLAEEGADAFVRFLGDNLAQLQYGAYDSWLNAEAEAWRLRAQGYTALIIPWSP